jgi:hypothetical protein
MWRRLGSTRLGITKPRRTDTLMNPTNMLLGLAPWILFSMIAERVGPDAVGVAALLACLGSLALTIRGSRRTGVTVIDAAGVVTFGVLAVIAFLGGHHTDQLLIDFGRGGSAVVLATVMLVSVFTVPFTEQFAREHVDRRYWGSPVFRAVNRRISLMWAAAIYVMAISHLTSGYLQHQGSDPRNLLLNWVVPIGLVLIGFKQTERIADQLDGITVRTEA